MSIRSFAQPPCPERAQHGLRRRFVIIRRGCAGVVSTWQAQWDGPTRPYDLLREGAIASIVIGLLSVLLAALFSSPVGAPVTIRSWSQAAPTDFVRTAVSELAGTSATSNFGPPYTPATATSGAQQLGPLHLQRWGGVLHPVQAAQDFVLAPLTRAADHNASLAAALKQYESATAAQRAQWDSAYLTSFSTANALGPVPSQAGQTPTAGPLPTMLGSELQLARSGALDAELVSKGSFVGNNYTRQLLFISDGTYFTALGAAQHLLINQWGPMNETGNYPGLPWMWLFTLWFQIPAFATSHNAPLIAMLLTIASSTLLLLVPFVPGLRGLPERLGVYRLIWRVHYQEVEGVPARTPRRLFSPEFRRDLRQLVIDAMKVARHIRKPRRTARRQEIREARRQYWATAPRPVPTFGTMENLALDGHRSDADHAAAEENRRLRRRIAELEFQAASDPQRHEVKARSAAQVAHATENERLRRRVAELELQARSNKTHQHGPATPNADETEALLARIAELESAGGGLVRGDQVVAVVGPQLPTADSERARRQVAEVEFEREIQKLLTAFSAETRGGEGEQLHL